jgi:hypothetical protein
VGPAKIAATGAAFLTAISEITEPCVLLLARRACLGSTNTVSAFRETIPNTHLRGVP